jgi:hypothetical protein
MNKKGNTVIMMMFEILIVIFVIYMSFQIASSYASSETANKVNLAEDISMMVNTLVGTPGNSIVEYPGNTSKYTFILDRNSISVFIKSEGIGRTIVRNFFLPMGYEAFGTLEEKDNLCLKKDNKIIKLLEC